MKVRLFTLLLITGVGMISCTTQNEDIEFVTSHSPVTAFTIESTPITGTFSIIATHTGSSGCSEYARHESTRDEFITTVIMFQKREVNAICTTNLIDIQTPITIRFSTPGEHTIQFRKFGPTDFITEKVVVVGQPNPGY